jgi:hypothetical protein
MDGPEIEYLDSVDRGPSLSGHGRRGAGTIDSRLGTVLGVVGWLIVVAAIAVAIGLSVTYRPTHGDPMRPVPTNYVSERGIPPAADLLLGAVGVVLGLGLVGLGRLLVSSASTAAQLTAITRFLEERHREQDEPWSTGA